MSVQTCLIAHCPSAPTQPTYSTLLRLAFVCEEHWAQLPVWLRNRVRSLAPLAPLALDRDPSKLPAWVEVRRQIRQCLEEPPSAMKVFNVEQPWAHAVVTGEAPCLNRKHPFERPGWLAIRAGRCRARRSELAQFRVLFPRLGMVVRNLPTNGIVAVAHVERCVHRPAGSAVLRDVAAALGPYVWMIDRVVAVDKPLELKRNQNPSARQGWRLDAATAGELQALVKRST
jgi:hypothetical protein